MSFLSKLTAVAMVVLGVHALQNKRVAKSPDEGTSARKAAKTPRSPRKTASTATRSASPDADRDGAARKARPRKRPDRRHNAKRAQT